MRRALVEVPAKVWAKRAHEDLRPIYTISWLSDGPLAPVRPKKLWYDSTRRNAKAREIFVEKLVKGWVKERV